MVISNLLSEVFLIQLDLHCNASHRVQAAATQSYLHVPNKRGTCTQHALKARQMLVYLVICLCYLCNYSFYYFFFNYCNYLLLLQLQYYNFTPNCTLRFVLYAAVKNFFDLYKYLFYCLFFCDFSCEYNEIQTSTDYSKIIQ